jgi:hypothetical protein
VHPRKITPSGDTAKFSIACERRIQVSSKFRNGRRFFQR